MIIDKSIVSSLYLCSVIMFRL